MLDDKGLVQLDSSLKRIFSMKITRSTFRELQNAFIAVSNGNKDLTNNIYESLFTGQVKENVVSDKKLIPEFINIAKQFSIPIRLSKEIFERGEFVNIITSDTIAQGAEIAFLNRIRRIDGDEFLFITDTPSTLHLIQHFFGRLLEIEKSDEGKKQLGNFKRELLALSGSINNFAQGLTEVKKV